MTTFSANAALGGDAYPTNPQTQNDGMSLLDWFAGQALAGMLATFTGDMEFPRDQVAAKHAYEYADAMLAERNSRIEAAKAGWKKTNA